MFAGSCGGRPCGPGRNGPRLEKPVYGRPGSFDRSVVRVNDRDDVGPREDHAQLKGELRGVRAVQLSAPGSVAGLMLEHAEWAETRLTPSEESRDTGPRSQERIHPDEWESAQAVQAFSANPQIQEFFSQMFEGMPEVTIWEGAGWNEW